MLPPSRRNGFRLATFAVAAVLLAVAGADAATLDTHTVVLDGQGKLIPWTADPAEGYDRVMRLSWDLLLHSIPPDPVNGLPVTYTHCEYNQNDLSGTGWPNNPGSKNAMLADSAVMYYAYSGDRAVVDLVRALLDHHLTYGTTPANYAWANVPWSTGEAGSITYGNDAVVEGVGILEPDKVGELGFHGYLRFYELTGDVRYRDAAIACADALAANIKPPGQYSATVSPWPFRVVARTGATANGETLCGDVVAPVRLFDELIRLGLGNTTAYQSARQDAWNWLMTYGIPNNAWANYFEDVQPQAGTGNVNQYNPGQTARYLLERPELDPNWQSHAAALIAWIEATFGGLDNGEPGVQYGAPVISEQIAYKFKMASHTSRFGAVNALYYARTGDLAAKEKAYRSLNWSTYMCRSTGVVIEGPAEAAGNPPCWFSDGHGDYIRHFMLGIGAVPEWAPPGQNHITHSTSVVRSVTYAPTEDAVSYTTFEAASRDTLRLAFSPAGVLADGQALPQRSDLDQPGWTFDAATGVLRLRHDTGTAIQVVAGNPGNQPPQVTLTAPADGSTSELPAAVVLRAQASDADGTIARVDFYSGTVLIGSDTTAPFEAPWSGMAAGTYSLTAFARDEDGAVTPSQSIRVTVTARSGVPSPWQGSDIGAVGLAGQASYDGTAFTVEGSGVDIWDAADGFHFVYQPLVGDGTVTARVVALENTSPWAMAGVMMRADLTPGSTHAIVSMTAANGWSFTWRPAANGASVYEAGGAGAVPAWVRLKRAGNQLTAYQSTDGMAWTAFAAATIDMDPTLQVGLAVSAVNNAALCSAVFDQVTVVDEPDTTPADLQVDTGVQFQRIDGFGVNANHRSWNGSELQPVLDALIDDAGMTLFRVVYDNTDWESANDNADPAVMSTAYYNAIYGSAAFSRLWAMADYLDQRGVGDGVILNFMGPGPAWMGGQTLADGQEAEWAEMIASLLLYARTTRGLPLRLVAPNNEPDIFNEGIHIGDATQYTTALRALAQRLDANGLGDVRFVAPDRAGGGTGYMPEMLADATVMAKLAHFGVHSYSNDGGGSSGVLGFIRGSAYPDRTFWMTELNVWCSGCDSGTRGTYDWAYCRGTADYLLDHLANGASAGIVWEGYDSFYAHPPSTWSYWGLFSIDDIDAPVKTYTPRKNFYTVAQISRFVRPGDVRVQANAAVAGVRILGFVRPPTGEVTIVGTNDNATPATLDGSVAGAAGVTSLRLTQTTPAKNLSDDGTVPVTAGRFRVTVDGNSVFTLSSGAPTACTPGAVPDPCWPCRTCDAVLGCVAEPRAGCAAPDRASLSLTGGRSDAADSVSWTWKGTAPGASFGDPTGGTEYALCIFDRVGGVRQVTVDATAVAGGLCGTRPCWTATGAGFKYNDRRTNTTGLRSIGMARSSGDAASIRVKGKGAELALPVTLNLGLPVTVQLASRAATTGQVQGCWGADFAAARTNTASRFRGTLP